MSCGEESSEVNKRREKEDRHLGLQTLGFGLGIKYFKPWRINFRHDEYPHGRSIFDLCGNCGEGFLLRLQRILSNIKNNEFVEKVKSSLTCDKIVEAFCSKLKNRLLLRSLSSGKTSVVGNDNINDELDLKIASVLQSTGHCYDGSLWTDFVKPDSADRRSFQISKERRSILPVDDTSQFVSSKEADIAILEEPEHLNWYHHGRQWTDKINHVVVIVLCLSVATQDLPKSIICNGHGVNPKFLNLDVFGNGEDAHEVQFVAKKLNLSLNFLGGRDFHFFKVFIKPSVSDVLCTATAEVLAMGKFFFRSFPNCLTCKTSRHFVARVKEALANEPQPLTPEQRHNFSWEALDRVLNNTQGTSASEVVDGGLAFAHYCFTGNEFLRMATWAIPGTQNYEKQHCKDLNVEEVSAHAWVGQ
ncbi:hypothetical protein NE237_004425 [Protea cynaroides]|uniref:Uncharacterized protein n=1 Tax=Protea cynaroides TaxID=273540 RepID=A0A9Q0KJE5_9MAGN|nr:hypothetical protein NE237_004425 [Protea cynaroides]